MRDIKLPPDLDVGESYGKLSWSICGITRATSAGLTGTSDDV
jgi:hypothetical protein